MAKIDGDGSVWHHGSSPTLAVKHRVALGTWRGVKPHQTPLSSLPKNLGWLEERAAGKGCRLPASRLISSAAQGCFATCPPAWDQAILET